MLLTILLAVLQLAAAPAASAPQSGFQSKLPMSGAARKECPSSMLRQAERGRAVAPRRLDQLPPGRLELTVYRQVDGCPTPAVLREGIGGRTQEGDGR